MGGLAILFVVAVYVFVAMLIIVKSPGWWKLGALLAFLLIPTADSLWGRYVETPRICRDAGLKIFAKASKANGLLFDGAADDHYVVKYGFPFVEGREATGKYYRFSKAEGQERAVLEMNVQGKAAYVSRTVQLRPSSTFAGTAYRVESIASRSVLGELITYAYLGGWAERFLGSFADSGPSYAGGCEVGPFNPERLHIAVFGLGE